MRKSFLNKFFVSLASLSLLFNSLVAPLAVYAEDQATPTPIASPEPSAEEGTPEPTGIPTPVEEPTPSEEPISTPSPEPVVTALNEATPTPTVTVEEPKENGHLEAIILSDTKADSISEFDLSYQTEGSATLQTDELDYAPTDTVLVTGIGFSPNKEYGIEITSDTGNFKFSDRVASDESGNLFYSYQLDGTYRPDYKVEVKDDAGQVVASMTFTDSSSKITTVSVSDLTPDTVAPGQLKVPLMTFTVKSSDSSEKLKRVRVQYTDGLDTNPADVSNIYLYRESATSGGTFDSGTDFQMDSDSSAHDGEFNLNPSHNPSHDFNMVANTDYQFYIVVDVDAGATVGNTIDAKIKEDKIKFDSGDWPNVTDKPLFDPSGNSLIVLPDTTPPETTIDFGPSGLVNNSSATFTFSANETSTFECRLDSGGFSDCTSAKTYLGLSEGLHTFYARATDTALNVDSTPATQSWTIDLTNPLVNAGIDQIKNAIFTQDATVDGAIAGVASYTWSQISGPGTITFGTSNSEDTTIISNTDGNYVIQLTVVDNAGNSNSDTMNLTWDATPPSIPIHISPANGSFKTTSSLTSIDWSDVTDTNLPVSYYYQSDLDGSFVTPAYTSGALTTSNISATGTPEGTYYWRVRAKDTLGNSSAWSSAWSIIVDNTAPSSDPSGFSSSPAISTPSNDQTVDVSWTTGGTDVLSGVDGYSYSFTTGVADVPDNTKDLEETITNVTSTTLADGTWYFHIRTVDNAGNWTSTARFGPFIVDVTPPSVNIISPLSSNFVNGTSVITFTDSEITSPQCSINDYLCCLYQWSHHII